MCRYRKARHFFFALVFTTEDTGEIPRADRSFLEDGCEELDCIDMTTEGVLEQIGKLNSSKSPGLDGIHLRLLKELKIAELLAILCNLSSQTASVLEDWWVATIDL